MNTRKVSATLAAAMAAAGLIFGCSAGPPIVSTRKPEHISIELLGIYEQRYGTSTFDTDSCRGLDRNQSDLGDSVAIDAAAKENADLLREQLTTIGLRHAQVAGPVVSGYLPICAIAALENCCSELRFVRRSISARREP